MSKCYICGEKIIPSKKGDGEHIIPNALGGMIKSHAVLCNKHNVALSNELDGVFIRYFAGFLSRLTVKKDRPGGHTRGAKGVHVKTGMPIQSIQGTLKPTAPFYDEIRNIIYAPTEKIGKNYKKKLLKENPSKEEMINNAVIRTEAYGAFKLNFGFDNVVFKRSFAKIAIGYAYMHDVSRNHMELALISDNDDNRSNFMKISDSPRVIPYLPLNQEMLFMDDKDNQNKYYPMHIIKLFGDKYNKLLYCYIELFSTFKFYVILSDQYSGDDFQKPYYYSFSENDEIAEEEYLKQFRHWNLCKSSVDGMYKACSAFDELIAMMRERPDIFRMVHTSDFMRLNDYCTSKNIEEKMRARIAAHPVMSK